ncbi:MAG: glucoamylase family protein [Candidatus Promineifilaceae bacterium]
MAQSDDALLKELQERTFGYFTRYRDEENGLIADKSKDGAPSSIIATGLGLAAYCVAAERGFLSRAEAAGLTLSTLRFLWQSPQGPEPDASGYRGFFYHFLDMRTGRRVDECELSSMDSAALLAGALTAGRYFDAQNTEEAEIRDLAEKLYRRADWEWMLNGGPTVDMSWRPEEGFLALRWAGYTEALLLYVLGLGSPDHPLPAESYPAWTDSYRWRRVCDLEYLHAEPLFIHQLSHVWLDFRGIQDAYTRAKYLDYFQNSRRAAFVQQQYAISNPHHFKGYGELVWGVTASDGPGDVTKIVDGVERQFYGYTERGVGGRDDGTLSPWASIASLPFAPELVLPTIRCIDESYPGISSELGFKCSFNPTFPDGEKGWIAEGLLRPGSGPGRADD